MKLYIKTFGCQMNTYDSDKIRDILLASHQMSVTQKPEHADIMLMVTCSVREKAEEKVYSELGRWRKSYKSKNPNLIIGVGGCVAAQEGKKLVQRSQDVNLVFGPQTIHRIPSMLDEHMKSKKPVIDISFPEIEKFDYIPAPNQDQLTAYVSIMEGCSKYCSYCIVPYTRGEEISRPFEDVMLEVHQLVQKGVIEITFLGQNVNDYQGLTKDKSIADLSVLIHYTAAIQNIQRIRFTTSHPSSFGQSLIDCYDEEIKLANHLHLPVQSGSDRLLAKMKRTYTALEYKNKIKKLRMVRPDICISSDFIVGFPGETDDDFQKTLDLVEQIQFDKSYTFIYSPRPGTPASDLKDCLPLAIKKQRLQKLQSVLKSCEERISHRMLGTIQSVLIIGESSKPLNKETTIYGRTQNNRIVHINAEKSYIGGMILVKIEQIYKNCLIGSIDQ